MGLKTAQVAQQGDFYRDGELIVRRAVIKKLALGYATNNRFDRECDVVAKVTLDTGGDFDVEVELDGNYRRNEEGRIVGWGALFKIALLLETCGITTETDDYGHFPREALAQLRNKEVAALSVPYAKREDGRYARYTYNILLGFTSPETNEERPFEEVARELVDRFKRDGYSYTRYLTLVEGNPSGASEDIFVSDDPEPPSGSSRAALEDIDDIPF